MSQIIQNGDMILKMEDLLIQKELKDKNIMNAIKKKRVLGEK